MSTGIHSTLLKEEGVPLGPSGQRGSRTCGCSAHARYGAAQQPGVRAERPCHVQGTFAQHNCQIRRTSAAPRLAALPQILPPPVQLMRRLSCHSCQLFATSAHIGNSLQMEMLLNPARTQHACFLRCLSRGQ